MIKFPFFHSAEQTATADAGANQSPHSVALTPAEVTAQEVRRRIELMSSSLSLPTVRKALGVIEGEHLSQRRGGTDELMDVRAYEAGDEARSIDWKISARSGRPMIVQRERNVSGKAVLLLDVGQPMSATCPSGEPAYEVAANALCMIAALSLRRSDEVSLVFGDAQSITRMPFHGGLPQFERTLDEALDRDWSHGRNIDALLDYAKRLRDRNCLIVLATDDHALTEQQLATMRTIARTHPLFIVSVGTVNPFDVHPVPSRPDVGVRDGITGRRIPAFLRNAALAKEVHTHRTFMLQELQRQLTSYGATLVHSASSEGMFHTLVSMIARAQMSHAAMNPSMLRSSVSRMQQGVSR
ncbi:hypothetical protein D2E26_0789 [Bifidobacterium dolichotidis]|uniref:DUF58 domain-containing protein n=1 Tax=Bifidobacterium dolichotidis TaxID=2306976 RepID=A0A430FPJ2_9BIFI|nr:DUF58 domain-containing protein [Bifidobacterium dolichotidis]RSX54735.1 hypothetical protein D2E26_0789 [Bifidobacterium dolichotidis]